MRPQTQKPGLLPRAAKLVVRWKADGWLAGITGQFAADLYCVGQIVGRLIRVRNDPPIAQDHDQMGVLIDASKWRLDENQPRDAIQLRGRAIAHLTQNAVAGDDAVAQVPA